MEYRKLFCDFSMQEKQLCRDILNKIEYEYLSYTIHLNQRMNQKNISKNEIIKTLKDNEIIEFHYKNSPRILIRGRNDENGYNICLVINLQDYTIITAYKNKISDNHKTLNTTRYSYVNIKNTLEQYI